MEHSFVQLMDLPDEIILTILNKLDNVEVLYSLIDVNKRFNQIAYDSIFTTKITLMTSNDHIPTLPDRLLDRFCLQILPKIHHKIQWLDLESASMERILLAASYPNLRQLGIFIMDQKPVIRFTDESSLVRIFQNQIVTLSVTGRKGNHDKFTMIMRANLLSRILTMFTHVLHLKFYQILSNAVSFVSFNDQFSAFSSTLVELHINVYLFEDCLYLLDGRFSQLSTLFVNVFHIFPLRSSISNKEKLINLKYFSLTCNDETLVYDEVLVPHLHRMSNLEQLALFLVIEHQERFIDGNDLKSNIVNHMPRLKEFIFDIRTIIKLDNQIHFLSNNDIQRTLTNFVDDQVVSCVDYFQHKKIGQCHFYTCPYTLTHYTDITNNFPGGLFERVQYVTLFDERPFEHTFFTRIVQAFPFLEELIVDNWEQQNEKLNDESQHYPINKYLHLNTLRLTDAHVDYAEQFLLDTKTYLSNSIHLIIGYNSLQSVTHNFTRDATRVNCAKVKSLCIHNQLELPKHFNVYFPRVNF